jgi:18S rRNA (guanine1575-N7)-methyltransferase
MSERAVELLNMDGQEGSLILDIGCGSGLSGEILSENGFLWLGLDISRDMLNVARERDCEGDLLQIDMGQGFRFRPGVFDGAISVSALQWLCVASQRDQNPYKRLGAFF